MNLLITIKIEHDDNEDMPESSKLFIFTPVALSGNNPFDTKENVKEIFKEYEKQLCEWIALDITGKL